MNPRLAVLTSFLIAELNEFWCGVKLCVSSIEQNVKCALLCRSCYLPAGRKVCGFLSYNARLGCSKCLKEFSGPVGSQNFSGFDRSKWALRSDENIERTLTY